MESVTHPLALDAVVDLHAVGECRRLVAASVDQLWAFQMTTLNLSGPHRYCNSWFKVQTDDLLGIVIKCIRLYQTPFQADRVHPWTCYYHRFWLLNPIGPSENQCPLPLQIQPFFSGRSFITSR